MLSTAGPDLRCDALAALRLLLFLPTFNSTSFTMATITQTLTDTVGKLTLSGEDGGSTATKPSSSYKYAHLLPEWHTHLKLAPLEPFKHVDPGHAALKDPQPQSFLDGAKVQQLTPNVGTEILDGVDLTKLDARGRSQLALLVAQRGVVVFRGQQAFIDADPRWQIECVPVSPPLPPRPELTLPLSLGETATGAPSSAASTPTPSRASPRTTPSSTWSGATRPARATSGTTRGASTT